MSRLASTIACAFTLGWTFTDALANTDGCVRKGTVWIDDDDAQDDLDALVASVYATCGSGNPWTIDGALLIKHTTTLTNVDALQNLAGITSASDGFSLHIFDNAALTSISGLRGVRGALSGGADCRRHRIPSE